MKELRIREQRLHDRYMGITKLQELKSDEDEPPQAKRQKTDDTTLKAVAYKNRIDRLNAEMESEPE